ncbi:unnamed protein product, partial [Mesorhabditis belari]|uniref:Acylaminoacyl-peptidase n=1 Tax=Mesorhabditis belari TaxID=2138241 RepID=A0AAF3ERB2_9BILA
MENYVPDEGEQEIEANSPFPSPFDDVASMKVMDVKKNTKFGNIIDYVIKYFQDENNRFVMFKGVGDGADKCISCVEVLKKRYKDPFYQWNSVNYGRKIVYWNPVVDGLDRLRVTIDTPVMFILVSKDPFPDDLRCLSMQTSVDRRCPFAESQGENRSSRGPSSSQNTPKKPLKKANTDKWKRPDKKTPAGRRQLEVESDERARSVCDRTPQTMRTIAEYGSWNSTITPDIFSKGNATKITDLRANDKNILWVEQNLETGHGDLWWIEMGNEGKIGNMKRLAEGYSAGTSVHEYGGGALSINRNDGSPIISTPDGIFWIKEFNEIKKVIDGKQNSIRFSDMDSFGDFIVTVVENHLNPGNPKNFIAMNRLDGNGEMKNVAEGADFYAAPRISKDGKFLTWMQWNHNNMPWDETSIFVAEITSDGFVQNKREILSGVGKNINYMQPSWSDDGKLYVLSDKTNYWNLYEVNGWKNGESSDLKTVYSINKEIGGPLWKLGEQHYSVRSGVILFTVGNQLKVKIKEEISEIVLPDYNVFSQLLVINKYLMFCLAQGSKRSSTLLKISFDGTKYIGEAIRESRSAKEIDSYPISIPRIVSYQNEGEIISGWFFPPKNDNYEAPTESLPPAIILGHEGPTEQAYNVLDFNQQFFTSRGFAIFFINHRGSTGFGSDFRKKLYGNWGIFDRDDIIAGAHALIDQKLVDPKRVAIMGASAGGYLLLSSILKSEIFVAAVSNYGVADLESLTKDTHKFELHYVEQLVAKYPDEIQIYKERSPIEHLERLHTPIAFFHGIDDRVVPKEHSIRIHEILKQKGIPTAIKLFPGEVHGFAGSKAIRESIEGAYYFLCRVMNIQPSIVSNLEIFNLAGVFTWTPSTLQSTPGLIVADFAQHFDPLAAPEKQRLDWFSVDLFNGPSTTIQPKRSVDVPFRANSLSWCGAASEARPYGILVIGGEGGALHFIDPTALIQHSRLETIASRKDHQGHVLATDISKDNKWAMSGGGTGQLLLWDLNNLSQPFSPGQPSCPDQVKYISWNGQMESIVASLSSHRASIWDLRKNGAPVVDLAEIGGGCDWAQLSWSPADAMTLWTASQADANPILCKWDLRYPTSPVKDHKVHGKGITCIDWNLEDSRFLLTASRDHQILLSDPESGDSHGRIGAEASDWARSMAWCPSEPDLVAVQYFQHPIQISHLQGFQALAEQDEQNLQHLGVDLSSIPTWVSRSPVGSKYGLGCRSASYLRKWDATSNQWKYEVEIKKIEPDPQILQKEQEFQRAIDFQQLAGFCEDKAHAESERDMQTLWLFLTAASSGQSRKEYLRLLGFGPMDEIPLNSVAKTTTSMENMDIRGRSVLSAHSGDSEAELAELAGDQLPLDLSAIDHSTWSTVGHLISGDDEKVLNHLLEKKDFTTALLLYRDEPMLLRKVVNHYFQENLSASSRLLALLATHKYEPLVNHAQSAPESWRYVVGSVLSRESDRSKMVKALKVLADRWRHEKSTSFVQSALCAVISGDPDGLLGSLESKNLEERITAVRVLTRALHVRCSDPKWETFVGTQCGRLIDVGCLEAAMKLLSEADLTLPGLIYLRDALKKTLGGVQQQVYGAQHYGNDNNLTAIGRRQSVPYPQQQANVYAPTSNLLPPLPTAPPSMTQQPNYGSSIYGASSNYATMPTPPVTNQPYGNPNLMMSQPQFALPHNQLMAQRSYSQSGQPSLQPTEAGPPRLSEAHGWNDPPPLPSKSNQPRPPSVMQVQWKPAEGTAPGPMMGKLPPISTVNQMPYGQGISPGYSPAMAAVASYGQPSQQSPYQELKLTLTPEDQGLVDRIVQIADGVLAMNRSSAVVSRVEELKKRLNKDLTERLAYRKLGDTTKNLLHHCGESALRGDFHAAQQITHQMVTTGQDFVEVSAFLPPLKSLLSQAAQAFQQNYR